LPKTKDRGPNLDTLRLLAGGAKRLAEVTQADLLPEVWAGSWRNAAQRGVERVAMLCRLAKGLGKQFAGTSNRIVVTLDCDHSDFQDWLSQQPDLGGASQTTPEGIEHSLREHLSAHFVKSGMNLPVLSRTECGPQTRHLHVQLHRWCAVQSEFQGPVQLESTLSVRYTDEEPDPGHEDALPTSSSESGAPLTPQKPSTAEILAAARAAKAGGPAPSQRMVHINHRFAGYEFDEIESAWARELITKLPAAFHSAAAPPWAGIGITCPNCGHPDVLTEREIPAIRRCGRCGHDALTGDPESVLQKARQISDAEREAGVLGTLFNRKARQALRDELAAERAAAASKFRYPEAVAENRQRIEELRHAAAGS
jgi:hypothetical protein